MTNDLQPPPIRAEEAEPTTRPVRPRRLADILSVAALQEIQDGYTAVTGLEASVVDTDGQPVTRPSHCDRLSERQDALRQTLLRDLEGPLTQRFEVPIVAEGAHLGALVLTGQMVADACDQHRAEAEALADRFNITADDRSSFITAVQHVGAARQAEAVRFLYLLADAIAEVCRQDIEQAQRVDELATLYRLSTLLAQQRDLEQVLQTLTREATEVLEAKACSIRLLDEAGRELVPKTVHNLSQKYLDKGPILLERSTIDQRALAGDLVYVSDMATDPRTMYPDDARREGLASILVVGLVYRGEKIGVMRVYSAEPRTFSEFERHLLNALAQLAGAAIENARLDEERREAQRVRRQVELAADVQRRLMPTTAPDMPPFDVAGRYEPCFELGGDFYDFVPFENTLGVVLGDVVGKGVAASLLMLKV
jgi:ligand-binding sensor protein